MKEQVHQHILEELKTNTKTDIIFVLASIILNFIATAVGAATAAAGGTEGFIIMAILMILAIVVSLVAEVGLIKGKQTRQKLIEGLTKLYEDNGVGNYYDQSLMKNYNARYNLFMLVVLVTGLMAILVPIVLMGV